MVHVRTHILVVVFGHLGPRKEARHARGQAAPQRLAQAFAIVQAIHKRTQVAEARNLCQRPWPAYLF